MDFLEDAYYTQEHEWVVVEEPGRVKIGISDFAQKELGDITYLELPEVGAKLEQGKSFGVVESVKAASDLYAPISGEVLEVNQAAVEAPELLNQDPYDKGWLLKVRPNDYEQEVKKLMDVEAYRSFITSKE